MTLVRGSAESFGKRGCFLHGTASLWDRRLLGGRKMLREMKLLRKRRWQERDEGLVGVWGERVVGPWIIMQAMRVGAVYESVFLEGGKSSSYSNYSKQGTSSSCAFVFQRW